MAMFNSKVLVYQKFTSFLWDLLSIIQHILTIWGFHRQLGVHPELVDFMEFPIQNG